MKTEYLTAGGSILAEKKNEKWQQYLYDGSGQLMAIRYKGADYYYIRDGLMCITGLVDANGGAVVNYRYDSWGKLISITGSMSETLGKDNPYRFKGYYYDDEMRMYYTEEPLLSAGDLQVYQCGRIYRDRIEYEWQQYVQLL